MLRSGHQARPAVVCMRGFHETRTLRANSGRASAADASAHHAVNPPSAPEVLSSGTGGALKTRSHEVHLNSSCGMLRAIGDTLNNFVPRWQQDSFGIF
jgi:hypothetical protein